MSGSVSPIWSGIPDGADKRQITALIEAAIRDGRLPRGERLPTERAIAEASGLSRNTVRDALARLVERGLIARQVGRGTFVSDSAVPLGLTSAAGNLRSWDAMPAPRELVEFRSECEPALIQLLVMNATDADLAAISDLALSGRRATTWDRCEAVDSAFHSRLFAATRNPVFEQIGRYLAASRSTPAWLGLKEQTFNIESWARYQAEHEAIAALLLRRDARGAREALRVHLGRVQGWVSD